MTAANHDTEASAIEARLEAYFAAPTPDAAFVARLERQLTATNGQRSVLGRRLPAQRPARRLWLRLGLALAVVVLALAVTLAAIGPESAMAQLRQWLGYVPGIGFVDLDDALVLPAPIAVTQGAVTLTVEQVLAQPERTMVHIRVLGLPQKPATAPATSASPDPELRLPNGDVLPSTGWRARWGEATLTFPPLPPGVSRVELALERLPLVPDGAAPDHWLVSLALRPAASGATAAALSEPYAPPVAPVSRNGVSVALNQVAHSPAETALSLRVHWPGHEFLNAHVSNVTLRDDIGHVYGDATNSTVAPSVAALVAVEQVSGDSAAKPTATLLPEESEETIAKSPLSPSASSLTLSVDSILFQLAEEAEFALDLGQIALGEERSLDQTVTLAGFAIRVTSMRLDWASQPLGADEARDAYRLTLALSLPPAAEGKQLVAVDVGVQADSAPGYLGSSGQSGRDLTQTMAVYFESMPTGVLRLQLEGASVMVQGPWSFSWPVPGGPTTPVSPRVLRPDAASARHGPALRVEEVVETDQLTAVTLELRDAPADTTLERLPATVPDGQRDLYHLTDDLGNHYDPGTSVGWQPADDTAFHPNRLVFPAVAPLARSVTLQAAAIEVAHRAPATLAVTIPEGLSTNGPFDSDGRSAPVLVDASLELENYRLRFSEARLVQLNSTVMLALTTDPLTESSGDRWITGLNLTGITTPEGCTLPMTDMSSSLSGTYVSVVGPETREGGPERLTLILDVLDAAASALPPGTYHVAVSGFREGVRGPWRLTWGR